MKTRTLKEYFIDEKEFLEKLGIEGKIVLRVRLLTGEIFIRVKGEWNE